MKKLVIFLLFFGFNFLNGSKNNAKKTQSEQSKMTASLLTEASTIITGLNNQIASFQTLQGTAQGLQVGQLQQVTETAQNLLTTVQAAQSELNELQPTIAEQGTLLQKRLNNSQLQSIITSQASQANTLNQITQTLNNANQTIPIPAEETGIGGFWNNLSIFDQFDFIAAFALKGGLIGKHIYDKKKAEKLKKILEEKYEVSSPEELREEASRMRAQIENEIKSIQFRNGSEKEINNALKKQKDIETEAQRLEKMAQDKESAQTKVEVPEIEPKSQNIQTKEPNEDI